MQIQRKDVGRQDLRPACQLHTFSLCLLCGSYSTCPVADCCIRSGEYGLCAVQCYCVGFILPDAMPHVMGSIVTCGHVGPSLCVTILASRITLHCVSYLHAIKLGISFLPCSRSLCCTCTYARTYACAPTHAGRLAHFVFSASPPP